MLRLQSRKRVYPEQPKPLFVGFAKKAGKSRKHTGSVLLTDFYVFFFLIRDFCGLKVVKACLF